MHMKLQGANSSSQTVERSSSRTVEQFKRSPPRINYSLPAPVIRGVAVALPHQFDYNTAVIIYIRQCINK